MCRKHGGSLLPQNASFPLSQISPPIDSNPSYKAFASGPVTERGFCSICGSALTFNDKRAKDTIEINLGSFDEDVLCGKRAETGAWEDEHGKHVLRIGGWGKDLGLPAYHIYSENEIPGVTDDFDGPKYLTDKESGKPFRGKARDLQKR